MPFPFEIGPTDVAALSDTQLTQLLHQLLLLEAQKLGLPKSRVSVSLKITIPDGGEDGRIEWEDGPEPSESNWISGRLAIFQVKATKMGPTDCGKEVVKDDRSGLKPRVAEIVERGGAYTLFYGQHCEGQHVTDRIDKIREAFTNLAGKDKANAVAINVFGAEKIATWASEYAAAVAFVKSCLGRNMPADFQTWRGWERDHSSLLNFHADDQRKDIMRDLRAHLVEPGGIARVAGLSGLGKTRLALELLRPPGDHATNPEQAAFSASGVYVGDGAASANELRRIMMALRDHHVRAVIVVDECPLELHQKLEPIVAAPDSPLSMLTLDFEPTSDPRSSRCRFYQLDQFSPDQISDLLRTGRAPIPEEHISKAAELAQGFPRMAELLAEAIQQGQTSLWDLAPTTMVERLVVRRSRNPTRVLEVAQALSTLEHLGVDGVASHELKAFADHICGKEIDEVHDVIRELEEAGIVYRRGDYVRLTPIPIAVALAAEWWSKCRPERAKELLLGELLPPEMVDATANQLKRLSGHEWVQKLVTTIYGPDSPFRQRDLLESARGSRLASSLAEVNPQAVCDALNLAFGAMSPEAARTVSIGRRDLVWCLDKLVWWPETFDDAAWLMLLFAAGENETWANNATNQFCNLFHVLLSGTEVAASRRLSVLERAIQTGNVAFGPTIVRALSEALTAGHFTRPGGPEAQGSGLPRTDWKPGNYGEIWEYWREVLQLLMPFLSRNDELGEATRNSVGENARGMILWGGIQMIEDTVAAVLDHRDEWPEMLEGLRSSLTYDGDDLPEDVRARIEVLVQRLEPKSLGSRLRWIVSQPSWAELRKDPDGEVVLVAEERAKDLAREVSSDIDALRSVLSGLVSVEQRQGFNFGEELATHVPDPIALMQDIFAAMRRVAESDRNPVFAMGVIKIAGQREPEKTRNLIHSLLDDPDLRLVAVDMLRAIGANDEDVHHLIAKIEDGDVPAAAVHGFALGGALESLSSKTVAKLISACADADDYGPLVALELLGMRLYRNPLDDQLYDATKKLLLRPGLVAQAYATPHGPGAHHFATIAKAYLEATKDQEFAASLMRSIMDSALSDSGISIEHELKDVFSQLLSSYAKATWPVFRSAVSKSEGPAIIYLDLALHGLNLAELVDEERLLSWCEDEPEARDWISRIIDPLREKIEGVKYPSWSDFAVALLDRYGSDPNVRASLSASIHSGAWAGSAVPRLTAHREAFAELKGHSNSDVAQWALDSIAGLDAEIERERKRDEEREFGIFR